MQECSSSIFKNHYKVPKKYFRKYLPTHAEILENRFIKIFGSVLHHHNLWHLNRRSVAGGVAIGAFTGLIPGPFQMLSAAILAILFRVNLPVAVATTWYTNPFTTVPLYYIAYKIGCFFTGKKAGRLPHFGFDWHYGHWFDFLPAFTHWVSSLGETFLIGTVVLASLLSVSSYFLVRLLWRLYIVAYWHRRLKRCKAVKH